MARTIAIWGPTGLATPTCKLMLRSALTSVVETITLTEHATVKQLYTGTVTAAAGDYRFNLLTAGSYIGTGTITVSGTDGTTSEEDSENTITTTLSSIVTTLAAMAATVWSYATRTLTQTAAAVASVLAGSDITIQRGDTVTISLTGLGALTSRTGEKLYFTVKRDVGDPDSSALIQISETTGAIYIASAAASSSSLGSFTVTNATTGAVTIVLNPGLTTLLAPTGSRPLAWDIQMVAGASAVTTLTSGAAYVTADVTRTNP